LVITVTNDPQSNAIIAFDAGTDGRLQTHSTNGNGVVGDNARGVEQYESRLPAAVSNGSGTVALFHRTGDRLIFEQLIITTGSPVSVSFANGQMYIAGITTVESFTMNGIHVGFPDGTTALNLGGGLSISQVAQPMIPGF